MADDRLMLSALKTNLSCSLNNNVSQKRCLIHVKLTDFCMKTVENLIDSEKGAYFSLRFDENGGKMSIPVEQGDSRIFEFKTAPLQEGEGQGSLECVHQALASSPPQDHVLRCWGAMEHKLTVQATDEVYVRTKEIWESAEKLRKGQRAQEIKLPQNRSKAKVFQSMERISPVPSRKIRPKPPPNLSKAIKASRFPQTKSHSTQSISQSISDSNSKPTSRSTHSLKDRIIHMLALKPHPREHIVAKLKKATKRSENAMSNLDSILLEVSEVSQGTYKLKPQYLKNLEVEQWPFYTDAQKQMLKRSKDIGFSEAVSDGTSFKRASGEQCEIPPKKRKLNQPLAESAAPKPSTALPHSSTLLDNTASDTSHLKSRTQYEATHSAIPKTTTKQELKGMPSDSSGNQVKSKLKKKKKRRKDEMEVVTTDPTSTTSTPDHMSQFPTLTCEEERQRYKQIFNKEYVEYLNLKASIDRVTSQNQKDCSDLSELLDTVPKHSEKYMDVKRRIQEKYLEYQQNRSYLESKNKFDELHHKLNHIKQMVLQYDAKHRTAV